ncbi:Hypothetical protein, putative [Bodo saltans]|uniref:C3H1-type domain-containing protein n=1 Tax=Bodo saltans TaxID=75058 RepID=A0A0S4ING6_BODSA|nr:Hypothetical protein, putative [Bodo saltans]|eukprot:CUE84135.1 Hypothetical protein, putative [Bodo saltans]
MQDTSNSALFIASTNNNYNPYTSSPSNHNNSTPPSTPPHVHQHRPYASFSALPRQSVVSTATVAPISAATPTSASTTSHHRSHGHHSQQQGYSNSTTKATGVASVHGSHNNNPAHVGSCTVTLPDGRQAMVVVDPLTRKLTIPFEHIAETLAQMRHSIPSLCQLFLQGRCRQGQMCHQVHADPYAVHELRLQVDRLPLCCVEHGDQDFTSSNNNASSLITNPDRMCIRVPKLSWNNGLIPIRNLSFTQGLLTILQNHQSANANNAVAASDVIDLTSNSHVNLCRLHIIDRCRFAEDCKFLHVCKNVAQQMEYNNGHNHHSSHHQQQTNNNAEGGELSFHYHQKKYTESSSSARVSGGEAAAGGMTTGFSTSTRLPSIIPTALDVALYATPAAAAAGSGVIFAAPSTPMQLVDFAPQSVTPISPNGLCGDDHSSGSNSTTEPSLVGSFVISPSISPMITKKYRGGSWSYDPYSGGNGSLCAPPMQPAALVMAAAC